MKSLKFIVLAVVVAAFMGTGLAWGDAFNVRPITDPPMSSGSLNTMFDNIGSSLDAVVDQSPAAIFTPASSVTTANVLIMELAGFAGSNVFGIYKFGAPATKLAIFTGAMGAGAKVSVDFADGGVAGTVRSFDSGGTVAGPVAGFGFVFGFFLDVYGAGADLAYDYTVYTEDSLNAGGNPQALTYLAKGNLVNIFGGEPTDGVVGCQGAGGFPCLSDAAHWYIAFEDLLYAGGDKDFDDMVVQVESVNPVPEPATMLLLGSGLVGVAGFARRKFLARR